MMTVCATGLCVPGSLWQTQSILGAKPHNPPLLAPVLLQDWGLTATIVTAVGAWMESGLQQLQNMLSQGVQVRPALDPFRCLDGGFDRMNFRDWYNWDDHTNTCAYGFFAYSVSSCGSGLSGVNRVCHKQMQMLFEVGQGATGSTAGLQ